MNVKPATVYKVENTNRYRTANPYYYLVVTENDGSLLFSEADIEIAKNRAKANPEDIPNYKKVNAVCWDICLGFAVTTAVGGLVLGYFSDFILNKLM
jgi:hypothetical protein